MRFAGGAKEREARAVVTTRRRLALSAMLLRSGATICGVSGGWDVSCHAFLDLTGSTCLLSLHQSLVGQEEARSCDQ